jgi:glycosyltransferase involved in cell wall biosynthesis
MRRLRGTDNSRQHENLQLLVRGNCTLIDSPIARQNDADTTAPKYLRGRWFVAMLQPARGATDWDRDGGLLCLGFRALGMDTRFIALDRPHTHEREPRIDASVEQMTAPEWWRQWQIEGVVLYSWAAPRYEPVARAIAEAGVRCVIKIDSDGYKCPRQGWFRYCWSSYMHFRDSRKRLPAFKAVLKTILFGLVPGIHDFPMLRHLGHADVIGIESPKAKELLCDLLLQFRRDDLAARVRLIPHPVTSDMKYDRSVPKEKLVVAVARWDAWQKDAPLCVKALEIFLESEPEYRAEMIGTAINELERLLETVHSSIRSRIKVVGPLPHSALAIHYRRAQVMFFASRTEGCPVSGEEALCCGCGIVGAASLPSMCWLCGEGGGTLAAERSATGLARALREEAKAWREGTRDPQRISALWIPRTHALEVAKSILSLSRTE